MKKQNVVSKRRPRQNILAMILSSAKQKQKSPGSASTSNTVPTSASRSSAPRKSNKLIASAVELTRRSKATTRRSSVKKKICLMKGSKAFYRGPKGIEKVTVVGVHHDAKLEPYYTIKFRDGKEKQMDGKCLTPIEEKKEEGTSSRRNSVTNKHGGSSSEREQPTDQCSSSSSEVEEERFQKGQDAYFRSSEGVTKVKIVRKIGSSKYSVTFNDESERDVEKDNLVGLIDLTSKELAGLMKEKNEKHSSSQKQPASSAPSKNSYDQGYEPETEPSSSENSYEDNIENSPNSEGKKQVFPALPCAVQMVEAKTEDGVTKLVPLYKADMDVYYRSPQGIITVHILKTHFEDMLEPFYTIRLEDGREKQTDNAHLSLEKPEENIEGALVVKVEEDAEDDDWYQEWKASQLKEEEALRDDIKEYEGENSPAPVEVPTAQDQSTQAAESTKSPVSQVVQHRARLDHFENTKEEPPESIKSSVSHAHHPARLDHSERSEPEPTALVPKHAQSPKGSETDKTGSECINSLAETPQTKKLDPDDCSTIIQTPQFIVGDDVLYNSSKGDHMQASVIKVRKDEKHRPYFVIKLSSGDEKKVYGHRLTPIRRDPEASDRKDRSRMRSRSRSVARQERGRDRNASSLRSTSAKPRNFSRQPSQDSRGSRDSNKRYSRRPSLDSSHSSRDVSIDRSKVRHGRRKTVDRSRSVSRLPEEPHQSRGRRAESQDPRGRSNAVENKQSRSRSKSVRARDNGSREGSEDKQRSRSRSRVPDESMKRSHVSKKVMVMGVSHRVQDIGGDDARSTGRSKSGSRWGKVKSSISSGISKAKQRSFDGK